MSKNKDDGEWDKNSEAEDLEKKLRELREKIAQQKKEIDKLMGENKEKFDEATHLKISLVRLFKLPVTSTEETAPTKQTAIMAEMAARLRQRMTAEQKAEKEREELEVKNKKEIGKLEELHKAQEGQIKSLKEQNKALANRINDKKLEIAERGSGHSEVETPKEKQEETADASAKASEVGGAPFDAPAFDAPPIEDTAPEAPPFEAPPFDAPPIDAPAPKTPASGKGKKWATVQAEPSVKTEETPSDKGEKSAKPPKQPQAGKFSAADILAGGAKLRRPQDRPPRPVKDSAKKPEQPAKGSTLAVPTGVGKKQPKGFVESAGVSLSPELMGEVRKSFSIRRPVLEDDKGKKPGTVQTTAAPQVGTPPVGPKKFVAPSKPVEGKVVLPKAAGQLKKAPPSQPTPPKSASVGSLSKERTSEVSKSVSKIVPGREEQAPAVVEKAKTSPIKAPVKAPPSVPNVPKTEPTRVETPEKAGIEPPKVQETVSPVQVPVAQPVQVEKEESKKEREHKPTEPLVAVINAFDGHGPNKPEEVKEVKAKVEEKVKEKPKPITTVGRTMEEQRKAHETWLRDSKERGIKRDSLTERRDEPYKNQFNADRDKLRAKIKSCIDALNKKKGSISFMQKMVFGGDVRVRNQYLNDEIENAKKLEKILDRLEFEKFKIKDGDYRKLVEEVRKELDDLDLNEKRTHGTGLINSWIHGDDQVSNVIQEVQKFVDENGPVAVKPERPRPK